MLLCLEHYKYRIEYIELLFYLEVKFNLISCSFSFCTFELIDSLAGPGKNPIN